MELQEVRAIYSKSAYNIVLHHELEKKKNAKMRRKIVRGENLMFAKIKSRV